MSKKKIILFIPSIEGGGVEKNFFLITNYLCKTFNDITVITSSKYEAKSKLNSKIKLIGPNHSFLKTKSRYPKYFLCLLYLIKFLMTNKHVLVFAFQANGYASVISKIFRTTIITRSNSSSDGWSKNILKFFLYKFLLKLPDPKYFLCLLYLIKFLMTNKHVLVFAFQANGYASVISKIFRTTIITRSNSSSDGWSKNILKFFLYKFLLKLPDEVIVNSYEFKKELDNKFNINTTVIYNPLNKKEIIKESKKKLNLKFFKKNDLKLITVGRLVDQKDQITLLKAINLIKKKVNFKLLIIGRGNEETRLKIFIDKNKITKFVKIVPFQKNPYKFIIKADLFILTSKFEGLPNVLLEAQSLKKYIISTNCPTGPKEILLNGRLGDLVKVQDYKKLASKILIFNKEKNKKSTYDKINFSFKKLSRFDYISNMKKYEMVLQKYIYV